MITALAYQFLPLFDVNSKPKRSLPANRASSAGAKQVHENPAGPNCRFEIRRKQAAASGPGNREPQEQGRPICRYQRQ